MPMDGARARARTHTRIIFFSLNNAILFRSVSFYFVKARNRVSLLRFPLFQFANVDSSIYYSFWFYSLSLSLRFEGKKERLLEGFWHSAGSKALKMPRVSLHLKFAGNVARRVYIAAHRDTELDSFQRRRGKQNEPSQKDTSRRE